MAKCLVQWVCLQCHCDLLMLRSDMAHLLKLTECACGCAWRWDTFLNCASVCGWYSLLLGGQYGTIALCFHQAVCFGSHRSSFSFFLRTAMMDMSL